MQSAVDFFRGSIKIEVNCKYPERFLNICAQKGIEFRNPKRTGKHTVEMDVYISGYDYLRDLREEYGFTLKRLKKRGVPFFLWKIRKRYALIAGLIIAIGLVWWSSFFIWQIEVSGNEKVSTERILAALEEVGVKIGANSLMLSQQEISNEMLLKIPELSWITVNNAGSRATVMVREDIPKPDILDESLEVSVIAEKSGIITEMTVLQGTAEVAIGDTVQAGDLLVSSRMNTRYVHAQAEIYARTWYEMSAQMPLEAYEKVYTGEIVTKKSLIIAGKTIDLYFSGGNLWSGYDKITKEESVELFGKIALPIKTISEQYLEYELLPIKRTRAEIEAELEASIMEDVRAMLGEGEILQTWVSSSNDNGMITVKITVECLERIDCERQDGNNELLTDTSDIE